MISDFGLLKHKKLKRIDTTLATPLIDFTVAHVEEDRVQITFLSGDLAHTTWRIHKKYLLHKGTIFFSFNLDFAECINSVGFDK